MSTCGVIEDGEEIGPVILRLKVPSDTKNQSSSERLVVNLPRIALSDTIDLGPDDGTAPKHGPVGVAVAYSSTNAAAPSCGFIRATRAGRTTLAASSIRLRRSLVSRLHHLLLWCCLNHSTSSTCSFSKRRRHRRQQSNYRRHRRRQHPTMNLRQYLPSSLPPLPVPASSAAARM